MSLEEAKQKFLSDFSARFGKGRAGAEASWLNRLRGAAVERFGALGLPSTRHEDWKYTSVEPVAALNYQAPIRGAGSASLDALLARAWADQSRHRLVFLNGRFSADHSSLESLPAGLKVASLASVLADGGARLEPLLGRVADFQERHFVALNTAFLEDGAVVELPANCRLADPIQIVFASAPGAQPAASHPRNLIVCGAGSEASIVESYVGDDDRYFVNPVTEIVAGENCSLDYYRAQRESSGGLHVGAVAARLERFSRLRTQSFVMGGGLVRNDLRVVLAGEGAECGLFGLYLSDGNGHVDNHTEIEHVEPRAVSRELYKGILSGRSHAVFNGKVLVHKAAQHTDARQNNKNLLLSKYAVVNSKPQLEIYADDVKCTHGSTIGQPDRDAIFYLRSRGIGADDAQRLLSYGFGAELLEHVGVEPLRSRLDDYLQHHLEGSGPA